MAKRILVADDGNNRFVILEAPDMTFVSSFGDGTPPNRMWTTGVAAIGANLFGSYGFDANDANIVSKWTLDGTYVSKVGLDSGTNVQQVYAKNELGEVPFHLVPSIDGTKLYVSDLRSGTIKGFNASTLEEISILGRYDGNWDNAPYCNGLAIYGNEAYINDSNRDSLTIVFDAVDFDILGGLPAAYTLFGGAMCCDATHIYMHSRGAPAPGLYKFDRVNRTFVDSVSLTGASYAGVAVDDTYVYTMDGGAYGKISKYLKSDLSFVSSLPQYGDARDLGIVWGLAVDGTYIYVSDYNNARIVRINKSTMAYDSAVDVGGQHGWPQGIAIDSTYLYVMSLGGTVKIAKYDKATITLQATSAQNFSVIGAPTYNLALDASNPDSSYLFFVGQSDGRVWAMDTSTLTVSYDSGAPASVPAARNIYQPTFFDFTPDGTKMLVSFWNNNTSKWALKVFQTSDWTQLGSTWDNTNINFYGTPLVCISNTQFLMFNDWDYQLEIRNLSDFSLVTSLVMSVANGFPNNSPILGGIAYDTENNKFYVTDEFDFAVWRLNGTTLAYEATSAVSVNFPMGIVVYNATPPVGAKNTSGQVVW